MKRLFVFFRSHVMRHYVAPLGIVMFGFVIAYGVITMSAMAGPGDPFGGQIFQVIYCTCSTDGSIAAVFFNDLTQTSSTGGLPLIYGASTITYQFGPPLSTGSWMLGTWQSGGECIALVGFYCVFIPTAGTMYMVGTSM